MPELPARDRIAKHARGLSYWALLNILQVAQSAALSRLLLDFHRHRHSKNCQHVPCVCTENGAVFCCVGADENLTQEPTLG